VVGKIAREKVSRGKNRGIYFRSKIEILKGGASSNSHLCLESAAANLSQFQEQAALATCCPKNYTGSISIIGRVFLFFNTTCSKSLELKLTSWSKSISNPNIHCNSSSGNKFLQELHDHEDESPLCNT